VWFTELGAATLGRVAATGSVTTVHLADPAERATWVATGPGPAVWFVTNSPTGTKLGRVDTTGHTVEQSLSGQIASAIGLGPDGRLWVAAAKAGTAWTATQSRVTPVHLSEQVLLADFAAGSDGNLWFVGGHVVGHIVIP
jgi:ligand-binding sensor domain-containing protein